MSLNLSTAAIARASSRRPWTVIGICAVVLAIALFLISSLLSDGLTTRFSFTNDPEFQRGMDLLEERLRGPSGSNEVVIVQSDALTVDDGRFQGMVEGLFADLVTLGPELIRWETLINY